jgi:hypothetical protein
MPQNDLNDWEYRDLLFETEREIMNDALGADDPRDTLDDQTIDDQSQLEGWDGRPLTDDELVTTTAYGHESPGFDRPLQWQEEQDAVRQNEMLRSELAARDQRINALENGPEYQAQLAQRQEERAQSVPGGGTRQRQDGRAPPLGGRGAGRLGGSEHGPC